MFQGRRGILRLVAGMSVAALLGGCGAGNGSEDLVTELSGGSKEAGALQITTTTVPAGSADVPYPATALYASGAVDAVRWQVAAGALPPGMDLAPDGRLIGTPTETGYFPFTVRAGDGRTADEQVLAIPVDEAGLAVVEGLRFGDAWSGRPVLLRASGYPNGARFEVVRSGSGGRFVTTDPGTATWLPGPADAFGSEDVLRAVDRETGAFAEVAFPVVADPAEHHVARFGTSDVWVLQFGARTGRHAYASDYHAALARLGLRDPAATDDLGSTVDQLADLLVRLEVLRHVNPLFLRQRDGQRGPAGLPVSFPLEVPGAGYVTAAAGNRISGRSVGYSVMSICDQSGRMGAMGMAQADAAGNPMHENNALGQLGELGVFVNFVAESVERNYRLYGDALRVAPVGEADVETLKALMLGRPPVGPRYDLIRYQAEALGRSIAYVAAHEMGHSLGLPHNVETVPGAIMNATGLIAPGLEYRFLPASLAVLRDGLPGAGRASAAPQDVAPQEAWGATVEALHAGPTEIHVCGACGSR